MLYRQRNRIEHLINHLKQFRRIATRYEKRADNYAAMLTIAAMLLMALICKHTLVLFVRNASRRRSYC